MNRRIDDARAIFDAAVASVQADALLSDGRWEQVGRRKVDAYERVFVAGMGKASLAMGSVLEAKLARQIVDGVVVVPDGYPASLPSRLSTPKRLQIIEGGHPVPNAGSRRGAERVLATAERAGEDDLLIVLISGGGSSLCADFLGDITLEDAQTTYRLLLESGADIYAMNTVRKHISRVGGGRLAAVAAPADVLCLVVSDVVGDDLSVIASGPTTGDPTTFADALEVLERNGLWAEVPASVRKYIERGLSDPDLETPKPGDAIFRRVKNHLLGTNEIALQAAADEARKRGYRPEIISRNQTGEAREVARTLLDAALDDASTPFNCLIAGGETTVTLHGSGKGGRNQEMALAAALALHGEDRDVVFLSGGTDGIDGLTDAAGAWSTPLTLTAAKKKGFDARTYLENNDSYTFFLHASSLLKTGHTHTNVMDVQLILVDRPTAQPT